MSVLVMRRNGGGGDEFRTKFPLNQGFPKRSCERVRIWLILTDVFLGRAEEESGRVSGKPAFCGWLVSATAMTTPDRSLNTS
jgi:hypothetical protein